MGFAAAIAAVAAVATLAAAAASAYAQYEAGQAQEKAAKSQARQAENQAIAARQAAVVRERQQRERLDHVRATARTRAAASGVISSEGSPLLVMLENARQAELEAQLIRYGGEVQGESLRQEAALQRFKGRAAKRAATIGAGATLLSGVATAASIGISSFRAVPATTDIGGV